MAEYHVIENEKIKGPTKSDHIGYTVVNATSLYSYVYGASCIVITTDHSQSAISWGRNKLLTHSYDTLCQAICNF
ncbi:hypothetical protein X777_06623 [Ooceraea biroi]|uniref:Uncharacterized protein n=1 Tax=Ooceraea biroi TaxID=2015173 RepID=A0A026WCW9_OOCBI|nr:hypothetical protein X777_06623 [Ooceraea biroi]